MVGVEGDAVLLFQKRPFSICGIGVTDAHILSYFSVFYTDLFDEVFVFEPLSLDMIRWLVTCCHHVHS